MSFNDILLYFPWVLFYIIAIAYIVDTYQQYKVGKKYASKESENSQILAERERALNATAALNTIILETLDFDTAIKKISSSLPQYLGYETGVLALIDEKKGILKRVGLSDTSGGHAAVKVLEKPFSSIDIKLTDSENFCIRAINQRKSLHTDKLYDVVRPAISEENANIIQQNMNTRTTLIFPIFNKEDKALGTFLISMSKDYSKITEYEHQTINNFIDSVRIALNNSMLYTSLERTKEQLENANNKLKELDLLKNEFVSVASHELRTPMTAIKSYLWMALQGKGGELNEKQKYYVERGYNSVDRLIRLVNDMLNISRIESGKITIEMQSVDIVQLTREVVEEVLPRANEVGVKIIITPLAKELPNVVADSDKIKEVLFNLIGNSLKFTPKDGSITIRFIFEQGMIMVSIKDTGNGIDPDDIGKLFQKFGLLPGSYTTNQPAMGTGLGLYICREILDMHHGKIWAESDGKGKGTTMTFTLKEYSDEERVNLTTLKPGDQKEKMELIHNKL